MFDFVGKNGGKLNQQIRRWADAGLSTFVQGASFAERQAQFLSYTNQLAASATSAGTFVTGTVGSLENATIFRRGAEYLLIEGTTIMSYVAEAEGGRGIVLVYRALGGK